MARPWSALARSALEGRRDLRSLAADGLLPLPSEELIALQVALARHRDDADPAARAERSLRATEPAELERFVAEHAEPEELAWLVASIGEPRLVEAALRRRSTPAELLAEWAPGLAAPLQEALLLRQDRIVERPDILDRLESNPALTATARRRIAEYREHLVRRPAGADEGEGRVAQEEGEASAEEAATEIAVARAVPAAADDAFDAVTGLSEGQVRALPPRVRIRLARRATAAMRQIMLRDPDPRVALAVLRGVPLSDAEVEQIARSRAVPEEVLDAISRRREWARKYPIVLALCANPRLPIAAAMRLLPQLGVRDLRNVSRDRNVSDAVRSQAARLYMIKSK
jgi:hypothetical protein